MLCACGADFLTSGVECEGKLQEIYYLRTQMYEATGGKVQKEKFMFHSWLCKINKTKDTEKEVVVKEDKT